MCYPGSLGGEEEEWEKPRNVPGSAGEDLEIHSEAFGATRSTPEECTEEGDKACKEPEHNEKDDLEAMKIDPS